MAIPTDITGGFGKPSVPEPLSKGRYRIGIKKLPDQSPELVPIFTNGHFGTLEAADIPRYGGPITKLTLPAYPVPDTPAWSRSGESKVEVSDFSKQAAQFVQLVDEFIGLSVSEQKSGARQVSKYKAGIDKYLLPVFEDAKSFLKEDVSKKTLNDLFNAVKPKVKNKRVLLYTDRAYQWMYWLQATMYDALDNIQTHISKVLYKSWKFEMRLQPYGMGVYSIDGSGANVTPRIVKKPGYNFAFYNHRAKLTQTRLRKKSNDDRYTYAYFLPFVRQTQRLIGDNKDIDVYALCAEILSYSAGFGETKAPDELPLKMDDIYSDVLKDLFSNISLAYDYIDFDNVSYYEIMKWNILRKLAQHRIKIPVTELEMEMETKNWEQLNTHLTNVIQVQMPSVGSDSTPYMVLADNMGRVDNYQDDDDAIYGFFLPYTLTEAVNKYRRIKVPEVQESFATAVVIRHGETDSNVNDPLNKTTQYYHYIAESDVRTEIITYYSDRLVQTRIPRHPYTIDIYSPEYARFLYVMSFMTNGASVYSDGLVVPALPQLLGKVEYVTRAIAPDTYDKQGVLLAKKTKDGEVTTQIDTTRIKDSAQPTMSVPGKENPMTQTSVEVNIPGAQQMDARLRAGIKPDIKAVETNGVPETDKEITAVETASTKADKADEKAAKA